MKFFMLICILIITISGVFFVTSHTTNREQFAHASAPDLTITTGQQLVDFANRVNGGATYNYVRLGNSINLVAFGANDWPSIGNFEQNRGFDGVFNGNNNAIIFNTNVVNNFMFGYITGEIRNLNIQSNVTICERVRLYQRRSPTAIITASHDDFTRNHTAATITTEFGPTRQITATRSLATVAAVEQYVREQFNVNIAGAHNNSHFTAPINGIRTPQGYTGTYGEFRFQLITNVIFTIVIPPTPALGAMAITIQGADEFIGIGTSVLLNARVQYVNANVNLVTVDNPIGTTWTVSGHNNITSTTSIERRVLTICDHETADYITVTATHGQTSTYIRLRIVRNLSRHNYVPAAPTLHGRTNTTISVNVVEDVHDLPVQFGISPTPYHTDIVWQRYWLFVNLEPNTQYYIFARTRACEVRLYEPGNPSLALIATTLAIPVGEYVPTNGGYIDYTAVILGSVFGGLAVIAIIAFCVYWFVIRKRKLAKTEV